MAVQTICYTGPIAGFRNGVPVVLIACPSDDAIATQSYPAALFPTRRSTTGKMIIGIDTDCNESTIEARKYISVVAPVRRSTTGKIIVLTAPCPCGGYVIDNACGCAATNARWEITTDTSAISDPGSCAACDEVSSLTILEYERALPGSCTGPGSFARWFSEATTDTCTFGGGDVVLYWDLHCETVLGSWIWLLELLACGLDGVGGETLLQYSATTFVDETERCFGPITLTKLATAPPVNCDVSGAPATITIEAA